MKRAIGCLVLLAAGLAACTDQPTITRPYLYGRYDMNEVQWGAGGGRDFHVVVRNNPYSIPKEELDQAVIDAIQGQITYMITNFTTTPGESARLQYRVEFMFDAPINISGRTLCNRNLELPTPTPRDRHSEILGAFCLRDQVVSEARGTVAKAQPGDANFKALFSILVRRVLPNHKRDLDNKRCDYPPCN